MKYITVGIGLLQGLVMVGALVLIESIVQAFRPAWEMPFSPWWGMIFALPAVGMAFLGLRLGR